MAPEAKSVGEDQADEQSRCANLLVRRPDLRGCLAKARGDRPGCRRVRV